MTIAFPQRHHLRGAHRGVVEAAEERFQVLTARALCPDRGEQGAGLGGAGDQLGKDLDERRRLAGRQDGACGRGRS